MNECEDICLHIAIYTLSHATFFTLFDFLNNIRLFRTESIHQHRNFKYNEIQSPIVVHIEANNNLPDDHRYMHEDLFMNFCEHFQFTSELSFEFLFPYYHTDQAKKKISTLFKSKHFS